MARFVAVEAGPAVLQTGGDIAEPHDQGRVADQGSHDGCLDQQDQALLNPENPDQQVRGIAESGIEKASDPRPQPVGQRLGAGADEGGERNDRRH